MEKRMHFYMTAGIDEAMDSDAAFASEVGTLIFRYTSNDWGDLCRSDCELNQLALKQGGRVLGAYNTSRGRVYIITDDALANNTVTTILFADEY